MITDAYLDLAAYEEQLRLTPVNCPIRLGIRVIPNRSF